MRAAERAVRDESRLLTEQSRDAVDFCDLNGLFLRHLRQNRTHATRQHRLARAGHTDHQNIMPSRRRNLKRTLRLILSLHIRKVIGKGIVFCVFDLFLRGGGQHLRSRQMTHKLRQIIDRIDL